MKLNETIRLVVLDITGITPSWFDQVLPVDLANIGHLPAPKSRRYWIFLPIVKPLRTF